MRARTFVIVVLVVVVVGLSATTAIAFSSSTSHGYRTATATTGAVTRELHGSGVIEPVSQATVAFPVSGTVATVDVKLGDQVGTGITLATLDTASLQSAVLTKQATLARAQLTLDQALNGQPVTGGGNSSRSSSSSSGGATSGGGIGSATAPTTNAVTTAVISTNVGDAAQAVAAAQHAVDAAMAAMNNALAAADTACGQGSGPGSHGPGPASTTTTTPTTTNPPSTGIGTTACLNAQQSLFHAQEDLARQQQALGKAENAYGQALRALSGGGTGATSGPGHSNSIGSVSGSSGGKGSTGSTSVTYSAEQLVAYQAAVDAASADVAAAQESVAQATIKSPIAGTVVALSLQPGQQVTAGSSTANVVIAGGNGYEIATSVSVNDITQVKVGDAAAVIPDGSLDRIDGTVVFIGSPTMTNTTTTYPVVIGLTGSPATLRNGAMATTTIDVATSKTSAVLVPTSAVQNLNGRHTVTVLNGGKTSTVSVQVGVVGAQQTEITSGLDAGQRVVLADLNAAVPSSSADSRIASRFGSGLTGGGGNGNGRALGG